MRNTLITAAAFSFMLAAGVAHAQTDAGAGMTAEPLPNLETFYTDGTMTTLRGQDELRASYDALPEGDRMALTERCDMTLAEDTAPQITEGVDNEVTASITDAGTPENFAQLCSEVRTWQ